ncbi:protein-tyrosine-phosphatase [Mycolicibacterium chubuense NBB4]|uniref:Protein-tyrosine-phosphatase n=1 Tax=Mycolicibacterium chubuense (strain NBB4) TaxID=710421 RepID=I4BNA4_MYCCN|nr:protein-tyrosine-phosphatase [Mycolicibacterium chubuense NBB4]
MLFVCARNSGKSPMAAGLMRAIADTKIAVYSAGTNPGTSLDDLSVQALLDVGVDITGEKPIDPQLLSDVDLIVTLAREVRIEPIDGVVMENWNTAEPSERGIDGIERMELIREDIAGRVTGLATRLLDTPTSESRQPPDNGSPSED